VRSAGRRELCDHHRLARAHKEDVFRAASHHRAVNAVVKLAAASCNRLLPDGFGADIYYKLIYCTCTMQE
jgi:hypothetical protein